MLASHGKTSVVSKKLFWGLSLVFLCLQIKASDPTIDSLITLLNSGKTRQPPLIPSILKVSDFLTDIGKNDSALYFLNIARQVSETHKDQESMTTILLKQGICYDQKGAYSRAAEVYYKALYIAEKRKDKKNQIKVFINLGILNFNLQKANDAITFYKKAQQISEEIHDTIGIIRALNNIGNASMTYLNDFKTAERNFLQMIDLSEKVKFESAIKTGYNNLNEVYCANHEIGKAYELCKKALKNIPMCPFANYNMASVCKLRKEHERAVMYYDSAIKYGSNFPELIQVALKDKADSWAQKKNFEKAYLSYQEYTLLKDSLHKIETDNHIKELEVRYQTASRETQIITLSSKQRLHKTLIFLLTTLLLLGGIAGFYLYRSIRHKKVIAEQTIEIKEQKIVQMEKDRQIIASHAVIEGEENERGRLARDLHDGLGGILSGIKLKLANIKGNYIVNTEYLDVFDHALDLIDHSIKELRRVAHNMMPETLINFGIKEALQDFCSSISQDNLKIMYKFFGEAFRFEKPIESTLYRIAQELVNNAIKHANASEILVQVIQEQNRVHLTVSDDGKGFEVPPIDRLKSAGLQNIQARVQSFNGQFDIDSQPGKGTEITVEFDLKSGTSEMER